MTNSTWSAAASIAALGALACACTPALGKTTEPTTTTEGAAKEASLLDGAAYWSDDLAQARPTNPALIAGIARNRQTTYTWFRNGTFCQGDDVGLCPQPAAPFSTPRDDGAAVIGTAIDPATGLVIAWYRNETYSVGTAANLTASAAPRPFTAPFRAPDLIDAYCASSLPGAASPRCAYYWYRNKGTTTETIWRSLGTPADATSFDGAKQVTNTRAHGEIVGLDVNPDNGNVYAWYWDGKLNTSSDPLNLAP